MRRQWIIRRLFLLPAAVVLVLWPISYWRETGVTYSGRKLLFSVTSKWGTGAVGWIHFETAGPRAWSFSNSPAQPYPDDPSDPFTFLIIRHFAGFTWVTTGSHFLFSLRVPYWFPFTVFAILGAWGWRRMGRLPPSTAFPVQVPGAADSSSFPPATRSSKPSK
jgi:hypothetical protein